MARTRSADLRTRAISVENLAEELEHPAEERFRFLFEATELTNRAPITISIPDRDKTRAPSIYYYGEEHFLGTASSWRGGVRRYCAKNILAHQRKLNQKKSMTRDTARLLTIGGVKGGAEARYLSPTEIVMVRDKNPQIDVFGAGDPCFIAGTFYCGLLISQDGVKTRSPRDTRVDPLSTLPIVRRAMLNDDTFRADDLSDPESLIKDAAANRKRSQINNLLEDWRKMERRTKGRQPSQADTRALDEIKTKLADLAERPFTTADEAETYLEAFKNQMLAEGGRDVSEANLQQTPIIPPGTKFTHSMELNRTTRAGVGLFLNGWHDKYCFNPVFGGQAARGCGGYLSSTYKVKRQVGYDWVTDCVIKVEPNEGIDFSDKNSVLYACFKEWQSVNIADYQFDFEALQQIIGNGE